MPYLAAAAGELVRAGEVVEPDPAAVATYEALFGRYVALRSSLTDQWPELDQVRVRLAAGT